ncbi:FecCD family ABC transporter permease [Gordonia paraffinivorans]|uniref:Probable ABC transporter permease protein HI_1471 n=1 Tax=Gordonia paraffinivorans TaxID=175628 RepID=A0ABD7V6F5_9ACTN|nr:iron ABC transporter permease [Gordonia paraffinivorans]MCD2145481.1 iron ABC transporter permease [Gordonia paraffinivorans]VFA89858.1 Probable ABC transporter permease protein HI_1471 [Gordonia paraffinivorans]
MSRPPDGTTPVATALSVRRLPSVPLALILLALTLVSITLATAFGAETIPIGEVWRTVAGRLRGAEVDAAHAVIVFDLRLPRSILAAIVGGGLALAGALMQALVRNPLAEPYLLGVSAGAAVGATVVITLGSLAVLGVWALSGGALLGSLAASVAVYVVARAQGGLTPLRLILSGVVLSSAFMALSSLLVFTAADPHAADNVMFWMLGSVAGATWAKVQIAGVVVVVAVVAMLAIHSWLDAYAAGTDTASSLGVPVRGVRSALFAVQGVLVGVMVAVAGGIGFVGLIVPHAARLLAGATHRAMLPVAVCGGALFLVWVDVISRVVASPREMPLGIVTGLIGAPVFLFLMGRRQYVFGGSA